MKTDSEIRDCANATRYELQIPPGRVDVVDAIRRLGVGLLRYPFGFGVLDGAYMMQEGQAFIAVNTSCILARERFTAAHELGHHRLGGSDQVFDFSLAASPEDLPDDVRRLEVEAQAFAAYFLMDELALPAVADRGSTPELKMLHVMSEFQVSAPAAAGRLLTAELISREDEAAVKKLTGLENRLLALGLDVSGLAKHPVRDVGPEVEGWAHRAAEAGLIDWARAKVLVDPRRTLAAAAGSSSQSED